MTNIKIDVSNFQSFGTEFSKLLRIMLSPMNVKNIIRTRKSTFQRSLYFTVGKKSKFKESSQLTLSY